MNYRMMVWTALLASAVMALPAAPQKKDEPAKQPPAVSQPAPEKPKYAPTADQAKDGRIIQLEAINAQQAWYSRAKELPEWKASQDKIQQVVAWCEATKTANRWPTNLQCDVNANPIVFIEPK